MNTNTKKTAFIIAFEGRYLENQTLYAAEILNDFISHRPLKDHHMVQNKNNKIPIKSLHIERKRQDYIYIKWEYWSTL